MYCARYQIFGRNTRSNSLANISSSAILREGCYYDSLGISRKSTQSEIKAAYYKLSMLYHPDKNEGCEAAAKKFRQITQAYEVLSNYKLRKLYDRGIIPTSNIPNEERRPHYDFEPDVEDDPATKFYKSRLRRSSSFSASGTPPIYNFDTWSREHYGANFERRKAAKEKYERLQRRYEEHAHIMQNEIILVCLVIVVLVISYFKFMVESSLDRPKESKKNHSDAKNK